MDSKEMETKYVDIFTLEVEKGSRKYYSVGHTERKVLFGLNNFKHH